jgi:hypothetical protein
VTLYNTYKSDNFEVLAFPCNQFGAQEPGRGLQGYKQSTVHLIRFNLFHLLLPLKRPLKRPRSYLNRASTSPQQVKQNVSGCKPLEHPKP